MFNKNYTGRKDIEESEVFNSQIIFPCDWFECLRQAKAQDYKYNEGIDFKKVICEREDLIREIVTIKVQISKKDYNSLKRDPSVKLTEDNIVKGELVDDNYGNTTLILETLKTN